MVEKEKRKRKMIRIQPICGKDMAEFSISGRVLNQWRLNSKRVILQGIDSTEYNRIFKLLGVCTETCSWNFWTVCVRVQWNTPVQLSNYYL